MSRKWLENVLIVTLIGIILCLLFPIIQKIIYDAEISGIKNSVYGCVDSVKILYMKESLKKETALPFKIVYNEDGYKLYIGDEEYKTANVVETNGRTPIGGEIVLSPAGLVTVTRLKYSHFVCSMPPGGELSCQRSS